MTTAPEQKLFLIGHGSFVAMPTPVVLTHAAASNVSNNWKLDFAQLRAVLMGSVAFFAHRRLLDVRMSGTIENRHGIPQNAKASRPIVPHDLEGAVVPPV